MGLTPQKQIIAGMFIAISCLTSALVFVVLSSNAEIKSLNKQINDNTTKCEQEKARIIIEDKEKTEKYLVEQIEDLKVKNMQLDSLKERANQLLIHEEKKLKNAKR